MGEKLKNARDPLCGGGVLLHSAGRGTLACAGQWVCSSGIQIGASTCSCLLCDPVPQPAPQPSSSGMSAQIHASYQRNVCTGCVRALFRRSVHLRAVCFALPFANLRSDFPLGCCQPQRVCSADTQMVCPERSAGRESCCQSNCALHALTGLFLAADYVITQILIKAPPLLKSLSQSKSFLCECLSGNLGVKSGIKTIENC